MKAPKSTDLTSFTSEGTEVESCSGLSTNSAPLLHDYSVWVALCVALCAALCAALHMYCSACMLEFEVDNE